MSSSRPRVSWLDGLAGWTGVETGGRWIGQRRRGVDENP